MSLYEIVLRNIGKKYNININFDNKLEKLNDIKNIDDKDYNNISSYATNSTTTGETKQPNEDTKQTTTMDQVPKYERNSIYINNQRRKYKRLQNKRF